MKRSIALLASAALAVPAIAVVAPAEAGDRRSSDRIKDCAETHNGVTLRVKMRDNGDFIRVRISHPDGAGNFENDRVLWARGTAELSNRDATDVRYARLSEPSTRIRSMKRVDVIVHFKLVRPRTDAYVSCHLGPPLPPCPDCEIGGGVDLPARD